ncbi:MAG: ATP-binding cassette domain-containing protein [Parvibaculales bacterium]
MTALITTKSLSLEGSHGRLLDDINIAIAENDFVTIIGPNGAGKTMLLKCLLGLVNPSEGRMDHKPGLRIGYMPQNIAIDPVLPLSVDYFLKLAGSADSEHFRQTVELVGISHLLNRQLHDLSGGERQWVLLTRALLNNPELLIMDEPAQNLDVKGQLDLYKKLNEIYETRKLAILMVSHDLHLVMSSSKKVICLFHHVCCEGEPQTVAQDPEFTSLFGDEMARMVAVYPHHHDHNHNHDHDHDHN